VGEDGICGLQSLWGGLARGRRGIGAQTVVLFGGLASTVSPRSSWGARDVEAAPSNEHGGLHPVDASVDRVGTRSRRACSPFLENEAARKSRPPPRLAPAAVRGGLPRVRQGGAVKL
jgi:hypothetical protein